MGEDEAGEERAGRPRQAAPVDAFGWRGWVVVAALVLALVVVPAAILVLPEAQGVIRGFGLTLRDAYLVLPLPAALLLGAIAVWSAVSSRRD